MVPSQLEVGATPALDGGLLQCENGHALRLTRVPRRNSAVRMRNVPRAAQPSRGQRRPRPPSALRGFQSPGGSAFPPRPAK